MKIEGEQWDRLVTVTMTVSEAVRARAACRWQGNNRAKSAVKKRFVPEPGKLNANEIAARELRSVEDKLGKAIEERLR